jgi:hypothetical protein
MTMPTAAATECPRAIIRRISGRCEDRNFAYAAKKRDTAAAQHFRDAIGCVDE